MTEIYYASTYVGMSHFVKFWLEQKREWARRRGREGYRWEPEDVVAQAALKGFQ